MCSKEDACSEIELAAHTKLGLNEHIVIKNGWSAWRDDEVVINNNDGILDRIDKTSFHSFTWNTMKKVRNFTETRN